MDALSAPWRWVRFVSLLGTILLAGCEDAPREETARPYPPRRDPLLTGSLCGVPARLQPPGRLGPDLLQLGEQDRRLFLDPVSLPVAGRARLQTLLEQTFGSVDHPAAGIAESARVVLDLGANELQYGGQLYRIYCLGCHGLTGDGRGPDAPYQSPRPRDFRPGIFKCVSTLGGNERKPCRDDLRRVLRYGVPGTSMRAYETLPENDREALASYTIHLSLRGEVEYGVLLALRADEDADIEALFAEQCEETVRRWLDAAREERRIRSAIPWKPLTGAQRESAIARGHYLFAATKGAGCLICHVDYGRRSNLVYDAWGNAGKPSDLTAGIYRGGGESFDLYCRIFAGINGASMPAYGAALSAEDIWNLVHFLRALPDARERRRLGIDR